jgi:hypothetical protein
MVCAYVFTVVVVISFDLCVGLSWSRCTCLHTITVIDVAPLAAAALLGCCLCFVVVDTAAVQD